jgi:hypothetical protein
MPKDNIADPVVTATVRVRSSGADPTGRPGQDALQDTAKILSDSGFRVKRVGRFGVSVEGETEKFARVLGVKVEPNQAVVAPVQPSDPKLKGLVDIIEAVPKPQLF